MNTEILKKVYTLSKERLIESETYTQSESRSLSAEEILEIVQKRENSELLKYLNTLTYDDALMVMTMMYIGRDYAREEFVDKPNLYQDKYNELKDAFREKSLVVNQIYQKIPLHEYLKKAFGFYNILI